MWEKTREDGTRKLKADAVPTIFSFAKPKTARKLPLQRILLPKQVKLYLASKCTLITSVYAA